MSKKAKKMLKGIAGVGMVLGGASVDANMVFAAEQTEEFVSQQNLQEELFESELQETAFVSEAEFESATESQSFSDANSVSEEGSQSVQASQSTVESTSTSNSETNSTSYSNVSSESEVASGSMENSMNEADSLSTSTVNSTSDSLSLLESMSVSSSQETSTSTYEAESLSASTSMSTESESLAASESLSIADSVYASESEVFASQSTSASILESEYASESESLAAKDPNGLVQNIVEAQDALNKYEETGEGNKEELCTDLAAAMIRYQLAAQKLNVSNISVDVVEGEKCIKAQYTDVAGNARVEWYAYEYRSGEVSVIKKVVSYGWSESTKVEQEGKYDSANNEFDYDDPFYVHTTSESTSLSESASTTDIRLGEGVKELGGLAVIGIGRMMNQRQERQARGRAGRQGEPGCSQFFVSLEDEAAALAGEKVLEKYVENDHEISNRKLKKLINGSQKIYEELAVHHRKQAVDYDQIMTRQRNLMYDVRNRLLDGEYEEDYRLSALEAIDEAWVEQVDYLQQLQYVVSGRSVAQRNPVFEYQREARNSFLRMEHTIKEEIVRRFEERKEEEHDL